MNMRTPASLLNEDDPEVIPIVQNQEVDFSEYMWMEEMEEFDRQVCSQFVVMTINWCRIYFVHNSHQHGDISHC